MILTDAQLFSEIRRCEYCETKPCKTACPCDCSPADFMMAAALGRPSDFKRAAGIILSSNPLGGICGNVCPDYHCVQACSREKFDTPIQIPAVQAAIVRKAHELGQVPVFELPASNGKKIAIVGAGPAGIGAAVTLTQLGYEAILFDPEPLGGQVNLIPAERMESGVLLSDLFYLTETFKIKQITKEIPAPEALLKEGYNAVIVAGGLNQPIHLNIPGDENAIYGFEILKNPGCFLFEGKRIALVGGAIAADQALLAARGKAAHVEMITLEAFSEMPLSNHEKDVLIEAGVNFTHRSRIAEIVNESHKTVGIKVKPVYLPAGETFQPARIKDEEGSTELFRPFDLVIIAVGSRPPFRDAASGVYHCGDMANGPTTVVEAVAAGKNTAMQVDAELRKQGYNKPEKATKSCSSVAGWKKLPVALTTDFFGRKLDSPFILSAAPPTDGYEQMKKAYEAGWAGGIMKTSFDNLDIHIPAEYMFTWGDKKKTFANCDNVSDHPLDRACEEIGRLIKEFPDRLTMASTGGPVSGDDEADKAGWQANTRKLEASGVMGIEYSLSCPQGGDGTHGDIVAQDAALTAKIIDWVMQISNPEIPKLFKLTGAVTAIYPIISAVKEVLNRYPGKKAGVTLANTFPTLAFRERSEGWDEGIIVGMSGEGALPISYLSLARAGKMGVFVSGNGGAMNYMDAANFLALGAGNVQFCTIAEKYGYGIIDELKQGLSYLLEAKGIGSVAELIGSAQPHPVTDFMDLPKKTKSSSLIQELCVKCGNCTRCPYLAISLDAEGYPKIDKDLCVGCSLCTQLCFAGALIMKED
ncbi:MAG: FAD-dependent oxidoreductase [Candidatus Cloacimonas sp.]|jgi:NADPH-dependent glutamate synthase beta subunit-like oxidoreductase/dihydroorotate dehydrogenase|nr:FAD-dependent oxidoreductase [Candidatus Cloacimonas sp.]